MHAAPLAADEARPLPAGHLHRLLNAAANGGPQRTSMTIPLPGKVSAKTIWTPMMIVNPNSLQFVRRIPQDFFLVMRYAG